MSSVVTLEEAGSVEPDTVRISPILELPLLFLFLKEELQGFSAGSKASRHVLDVPRREGRGAPMDLTMGRNPERAHGLWPWRESKDQHNLAVSHFKVHARPRLDVAHGADLLWDDDLAFRADDG